MKPKEQEMRISDEEISLLKNTFAENSELLKKVRKVFFQLPMSKNEADEMTYVFDKNETLQKLMRKLFLPEVEGDALLGQTLDLWMTVSIAEKSPEMARIMMLARQKLIDLVEDGLKNLIKPVESELISQFVVPEDADDAYVALTARNVYISHVEQQLMQIKVLAGRKDETVDETKARLAKDSAK